MKPYLILAINPGSTSTKIALFRDEVQVFKESIEHPHEVIEKFGSILEQIPMRKAVVLETMEKHGYHPQDLATVMGRGGMFPPLKTGGYRVNEKMLRLILNEEIPAHASNLGAVLADEIAGMAGVPAYIYDAVSANDFPPVAEITGIPEVKRQSLCHALNSRAAAVRYAASIGKRYEDLNLLVAHLGGGISISAHKKGKLVDSLGDDTGPFSPERAGSVPVVQVINMCFSGEYQKKDMIKKIRGMGGLRALLGTSDCRKIEKMVEDGDEHAKLILEAQVYQISKGISLLCFVLEGDCDAIILTGGVAHSKFITQRVEQWVRFIAPVVVFPGEFEMEALAEGGLRILRGEETTREM